MATGNGDSLGRALINALAQAAGGAVGVRRSYTAKGWHAQISKLTSSPRGYEAAAKVGLSATPRTLKAWLAEQVSPSPANQRKIAEAYALMAGRWPGNPAEVRITGRVKMGDDDRFRGSDRTAPLIIDGTAGDWRRIREAWEAGDLENLEDLEDHFSEDIVEADLGEGSEPWEFPGSDYTVTIY